MVGADMAVLVNRADYHASRIIRAIDESVDRQSEIVAGGPAIPNAFLTEAVALCHDVLDEAAKLRSTLAGLKTEAIHESGDGLE